jgi:hypothetical protein
MTTPPGARRYLPRMPIKKTVLTFGLISGALSSAMMLVTVPFMERIGFDRGVILGYTAIVLSFLLVFFGIRSYREQSGGTITFGRAFTVGILITLISCAFYVATWQFIYFKVNPRFADQYAAYTIDKARASGATDQAIADLRRQMADFKVLLDQPLYNAALAVLEPLPVGLLVTLVSAAVLRKKQP